MTQTDRRAQIIERLQIAEESLTRAGRLLVKEAHLGEGEEKRLAMHLAAKCAVIQNHVEDMRRSLS